MRILLDECIDEGFRHYLKDHQCETCRYAGLKGVTNGELLRAAEQAGFHVLITVDGSFSFQQRIKGRTLSLVVLQSWTTNLEDLVPLIPKLRTILDAIRPGDVIVISSPDSEQQRG